ncbi:MAG: CDP-diacylglycerol--glycerol-3-phosphate 3-phosphatidyltransferase [Alphaproteobacteria bacterium]|nr:CDP-diacylglycerol--glycerol-3-phosphate 3-phosphatidyltransferase [Alphaproteobacteria bacterium]
MFSRQQIPNLLTFARVAAVPVCLLLMLAAPAWNAALLWIFIAAALTDFLDGYLARRWQAVSPLGALLDPVADKLLVALMLLYLLWDAAAASPAALFPPVVVILLRELYIAGLREFLANRQISLPVSRGGKWKTALQMLAIALLLARGAYGDLPPWTELGLPLLYASALLALTSAASYSRASLKHLR